MSTDLEAFVAKVKDFSVSDLLTVQESVIAELPRKTAAVTEPTQPRPNTPEEREAILSRYFMPKKTQEEVDSWLAEMFSPEIVEEAKKLDLSTIPPLPPGAKSTSQLIIEDREDRL